MFKCERLEFGGYCYVTWPAGQWRGRHHQVTAVLATATASSHAPVTGMPSRAKSNAPRMRNTKATKPKQATTIG